MTDDKKMPEIQNIEPIQEGSPDADGPVHTGTPLQSGAPKPSSKEKPDDPNLGKVLKQTYTLVKKVGEGGMGVSTRRFKPRSTARSPSSS